MKFVHLCSCLAAYLLIATACANPIILDGPTGSGTFGASVAVLPNGNFVVADPEYDAPGPMEDVGAVYLFSPTLNLISTLTGSSQSDRVGSGGVTILPNSNFVVSSPNWDGMAGAVTWRSGALGVSGAVSSSNSLIGGLPFDLVGSGGITVLANGHFVVSSPDWNSSTGAATWASGDTGRSGLISMSNSLVGVSPYDWVGSRGITALSNGNYVVASPSWDSSGGVDVGAATWGSGTTGVEGLVSMSNSLVGGSSYEYLSGFGPEGVTALTNGNYVVLSPLWDNGSALDAGAATWGDGSSGFIGTPSSANSFVGTTSDDRVSFNGVTALTNGNYVVLSLLSGRGAATWGDGSSGSSGAVSASNSLIGKVNDRVGSGGAAALPNGNYVVSSSRWSDGIPGGGTFGAVSLGDGEVGISGLVTAENSLVAHRFFGPRRGLASGGTVVIVNGNYVVSNGSSINWFSSESRPIGILSRVDSFIADVRSLTPLTSGNILIANSQRVRLLDGTRAPVGEISASNSLTVNPLFVAGEFSAVALSDGNYVVSSPQWGFLGRTQEGAVTWGNGTTGVQGIVTPSNSLFGDSPEDQAGSGGVFPLPGGRYAVHSPLWNNGSRADAGAMTLVDINDGTTGTISSRNSLLGTIANGGDSIPHSYDHLNDRLLVGYPAGNHVGFLAFYPEISVEQPVGQGIVDGGARDFGAVLNGGFRSLTFSIKNSKTFELTDLGINIDGPNATEFLVTESPTAPVIGPNGITSFTVQFEPIGLGTKTATLHIANNDVDEGSFDISLTGKAVATWSYDLWSSDHFTAVEMANPTVSGIIADPDSDGWSNLLEYALLGNPLVWNGYPDVGFGSATTSSRLTLVFDRDRSATDITLTVHAADSPAGPWEPAATSSLGGSFVAEAGYLISADDTQGNVAIADKITFSELEHPRRFMRLTATLPP